MTSKSLMILKAPITILPRYLLSNAGTEYEGFDTLTDWTLISGTSMEADTTNFRTGTASVKVTTTSGGDCKIMKTISTVFGTAPRMRLSFYLYDSNVELSDVLVTLTSVSSFAKKMSVDIPYMIGFHTGWNTIDIFPTDWTNTGGEDWANTMIRLRLSAVARSSQIAHVSWDSLINGLIGYPAIILSFDDAFDDFYTTAYPLLKARHMAANVFVISSLVDTAGYCTSAQLQEISASGLVCVGNHTADHAHLLGVAEATQEADIGTCKTFLAGLGITTGDHYVQPYGEWDENTLTACRNLSIKTGRTVRHAYPITNADQMLLEGCYSVLNTDSLAKIEAYIDATKTVFTPDWLQFHHIVASPASTYQWSTADFTALLDYMKAQGVRSLRCDEFYNTLAGPVTINHY